MKISHHELMKELNLKSANTISHMKKNDAERYQLLCDGIRYRRLQEKLNTENVEGMVEKVTEALRTLGNLVKRMRNLRPTEHITL